MIDVIGSGRDAATNVRLAPGDIFSSLTDDAVPILDQHDIVDAFRRDSDSVLEFVPAALATYVDFKQHQCL